MSGSEHILHLWLLCLHVFSQPFSLPERDFGLAGGMLVCRPAELAWAEGHISPGFLGWSLRCCSLQGVFRGVPERLSLKRLVRLAFGRKS